VIRNVEIADFFGYNSAMLDNRWRMILKSFAVEGILHCPICGRKLEAKDITKDHIIPKDHNDSIKNDDFNWLPLCKDCNHEKGNLPMWQFWLAKELLRKREKVLLEVVEGKTR